VSIAFEDCFRILKLSSSAENVHCTGLFPDAKITSLDHDSSSSRLGMSGIAYAVLQVFSPPSCITQIELKSTTGVQCISQSVYLVLVDSADQNRRCSSDVTDAQIAHT
jgi:hypothetical protein